MRVRSCTVALTLVGVLLATAGLARRAAAVCAAAEIVAQDAAHCPNDAGPCTIAKAFTIDDNCELDFGSRDVTITSVLDISSGALTLKAGSVTVAASGRIAGSVGIFASRTVTNAGQIEAPGSYYYGGGITVDAGGDIVSIGRGVFSARGGYIDFRADGKIDLANTIDVSGDANNQGGFVEIDAGDQVIVHRMLAYSLADGASAGSIEINAGTSVQILGDVELQGANDIIGESDENRFGGNGGRLSARAAYGDLLVAADIDASGGRPGGYGGDIELSASGDLSVQNAKFNVRTYDAPDSVGYVALEAGLSLTFSGYIDASGGNIGGELDLLAGGAMTLSGSINARARGVFGEGGMVTISAAREVSGPLTISGTIDASGASLCIIPNYCGAGGIIEVDGCAVSITGQLKAAGAIGGSISVGSREQLRISGSNRLNAASTAYVDGEDPADVEGVITIAFRKEKPPIGLNAVFPPAIFSDYEPSPCPACGNSAVESPETCDDGNTVSCDGCSRSCQKEDCDDGNVCTIDSCTDRFGCRNRYMRECQEPPTPTPTDISEVTPPDGVADTPTITPTRTPSPTPTATRIPTPSMTPSPLSGTVCTAADIVAQDAAHCPNDAGLCTIAKSFTVADRCVLDFGTRAVTITGVLDFNSGTVSLKAGSLTIAAVNRVTPQIDGRGDGLRGAGQSGGRISIETIGDVTIQGTSSLRGRIDVSGNSDAGSVVIRAGGTVTNAGRVEANGSYYYGKGGEIIIRAAGDIVSPARGVFNARGGTLEGRGGDIDFEAVGKIELGDAIDVSGAGVRRAAGNVKLTAGGPVLVHDILAYGNDDDGTGGGVDIIAGTGVQILGDVQLQGANATSGAGKYGGVGGRLDVEARYGDVLVVADIEALGGRPNGFGGLVAIRASGALTVQDARISVRGDGTQGLGGEVSLAAGLSLAFSGSIDASGAEAEEGVVTLAAGTTMTVAGSVNARARETEFPGGNVEVYAGKAGIGTLTISGPIDVTGGGNCSVDEFCGPGGAIGVAGCAVNLTGQLTASGGDGGLISVQSREQLTISGSNRLNATRTSVDGEEGSVKIAFRADKPPIGLNAVSPAPVLFGVDSLAPCPTCGNHTIELPEICDDGNTVSCDGCSSFCQPENCDDGRACTTDSCDSRLGCLWSPSSASCGEKPAADRTITPTLTPTAGTTGTPTPSVAPRPSPTASPPATATQSPGIPADGNCDNQLSAADLTAIVMQMGQEPAACRAADFNQDGVVSATDLAAAIRLVFIGVEP